MDKIAIRIYEDESSYTEGSINGMAKVASPAYGGKLGTIVIADLSPEEVPDDDELEELGSLSVSRYLAFSYAEETEVVTISIPRGSEMEVSDTVFYVKVEGGRDRFSKTITVYR